MEITSKSWIVPQSFHFSFPILGAAISETEKATQAPEKLVTHCAVNAIFAAVQGLANFKRLDGGISPVSNISWMVGETGERKSSVDHCFFAPMDEFRESNGVDNEAEVDYRVARRLWEIREKVLAARMAKLYAKRSPWSKFAEDAMRKHEAAKPKKLQRAKFMYEDTSPLMLKLGLVDYPAACVHSSDAMSILEGRLFDEMPLLCKLYSGETHHFDRNGKEFSLRDKRLCVSAHSQPQRTFAFLQRQGEDYRDSGLAARMTVCLVNNSTQGWRTYDSIEFPTVDRNRFQERVKHLLAVTKRASKRRNFKRRLVKLSAEAARAYLEFANEIEQAMQPGGKFHHLKDYANRLADKVGRLATALHVFEGFEGDISLSTFVAARSFYDEATKDFEYLFNYLPSDQCLADLLLQWLRNYQAQRGQSMVKKAFVLKRTHPKLRKKAALDSAISLLEQQRHVYLHQERGTTFICLGQAPGYGWAMMTPQQRVGWG